MAEVRCGMLMVDDSQCRLPRGHTGPCASGSIVNRADRHGNTVAREGCDRCACGCKYWENDKCVDCNAPVSEAYNKEVEEARTICESLRYPELHSPHCLWCAWVVKHGYIP